MASKLKRVSVISVPVSRSGLTDVAVVQLAVGIVPQLPYALGRTVNLAAVLSVLPVVPVVRLTLIPEPEHESSSWYATWHFTHQPHFTPPRQGYLNIDSGIKRSVNSDVVTLHWVLYQRLLACENFLLLWGQTEVCSIHPAPMSLMLSLHQPDPIAVLDFNYSWYEVLEIKEKRQVIF